MTIFGFKACLLTLAFFCIWGAHSLEYNDLEIMGVSCPDRDSCAVMRDKTFFQRNCECDRLCKFYDGCCIDFHQEPRGLEAFSHVTTKASCMTFAGQDNVGVFTIDKCRDLTGTAEEFAKCEHPSDMSDPLVEAPVTDVHTNVTYRNMYCALCNGVQLQQVTSWAINVVCENASPNVSYENIMDTLVYRWKRDQWGIADWNGGRSVFRHCNLVFYLPERLMSNVRLCRANVVSTCPRSWRRKSIKVMCMSYTAVVVNLNTVFKNPHCAVCNGVGLNWLTCEYGIFGRKQAMNFGMLLDVNQSDGGVVGVTRTASCPANQFYDRFTKRCRSRSCGIPGFTLKNGICVRS